jgi:cellulose synthase/poly-beta-1,6-N-acetylglucosamine synthase-like glycosyltransferase
MIWILVSVIWVLFTLMVLIMLHQRYAALVNLIPRQDWSGDLPTIAVIIPARNEVENITKCLHSLAEQSYPVDKMQIVLVDDGSTDDTVAIAKTVEMNTILIRFIEAGTLPEGWLGKPHACWQGARSTEADWLCFLDADTQTHPDCLVTAMQTALTEQADLLSLHPAQEMRGFWERLLMPIPFMTLMILMDAKRINDPNYPTAMANGQFILIKQEVYQSVGGHEAIRDTILEDVALARQVKSSGYSIKLFGGDKLIQTRMYSEFWPLWEGIARGGSELFGVPVTSLAVVNAFFASFFPIAYPIWRTLVALNSSTYSAVISAGLAVLGTLFWYTFMARGLKQYKVPYTYLLLIPLSNLIVAVINIDGLARRLRKNRKWKGRVL